MDMNRNCFIYNNMLSSLVEQYKTVYIMEHNYCSQLKLYREVRLVNSYYLNANLVKILYLMAKFADVMIIG